MNWTFLVALILACAIPGARHTRYFGVIFLLWAILLPLVILLLPIPKLWRFVVLITFLTIFWGVFRASAAFHWALFRTRVRNVKELRDNSELRQDLEWTFGRRFNLVTNFQDLPSKPSLIVCNYCSDRIENMACALFPIDMTIMMQETLEQRVKLSKIVKWVIITTVKPGNYERISREVTRSISEGRSVFAYVSKSSYVNTRGYVKGIRSGLFRLSKETGIPVTLAAIDFVDFGSWGLSIPRQNFQIRVGETFVVEDVPSATARAATFYKNCMRSFVRDKYKNVSLDPGRSCGRRRTRLPNHVRKQQQRIPIQEIRLLPTKGNSRTKSSHCLLQRARQPTSNRSGLPTDLQEDEGEVSRSLDAG